MIQIIIYNTGRVSATRAKRLDDGKIKAFNCGRPKAGESLDGFKKRCYAKDPVVEVVDLRENSEK